MKQSGSYVLTADLDALPGKRYFSVSETARLCQLKPHVLRYWEQEFEQLDPNKRRGNHRYYQHDDIVLIRKIRELLYEQGFTIQGANVKINQKLSDVSQVSRQTIKKLIADLEDLLVGLQA